MKPLLLVDKFLLPAMEVIATLLPPVAELAEYNDVPVLDTEFVPVLAEDVRVVEAAGADEDAETMTLVRWKTNGWEFLLRKALPIDQERS